MEQKRDEVLGKIIRNCVRKDGKAQEMLYKRFFGYAMGVALLYNKQKGEALEVVNDSFLKVFTEIPKFDTSKPFKAWLRKIVINSSIDRFRRESRSFFYNENESFHVPDSRPNIISDLTAQDVIQLLHQLPDMQRIVFSLYEIDGFNHDEIGEKLNIPASSSRVYLTRAKRKLRKLYPIYFSITYEKPGKG
ncbi:MAG: RNA polymerase sigma factor [Prolixibacteraceae bacterium]